MGKAVIYIRVSSKEQIEGTSLSEQKIACHQWCAQQNLSVARVFVEQGESAKTADRTQFQAMFRYLESGRNGISHLVVDRLDRFSRDPDETGHYMLSLRQRGIALCSVKEPTDNTPAGRFLAGMLGLTARLENETRGARALSGMQARFRSDRRWVWVAPLGYRNGRGKQEASLIPDPERAPLIRKFFELVASGTKIARAAAEVTALGLRTVNGNVLPPQTAVKLLRNPIYFGQMRSRKWGDELTGDFEPLITEELFLRTQQALDGRGPRNVKHHRSNPQFPLRGALLCPRCGLPVTASMSKGKTRHYGYYSCHRAKDHLRVRADLVEMRFVALLERLQPDQDRMRLIDAIFRQVWTDKQNTAQSEATQLAGQLKRLETRKQNILNKIDKLKETDFDSMYQSTISEIQRVKLSLLDAQRTVIDVDTALSYLMHLLWNSHILWETSDLEVKQRLARLIFPEGVTFSNDDFGTPVTHSIFSLLADKSVEDGVLVGPEGFEPPTKGL